jgi:hypothetical protein
LTCFTACVLKSDEKLSIEQQVKRATRPTANFRTANRIRLKTTIRSSALFCAAFRFLSRAIRVPFLKLLAQNIFAPPLHPPSLFLF